MIRAVAWDIDGTLVDSEPRHHRALVAASADLGVDLSDLPDQAFRGVHMLDVWEALRNRYPSSLNREAWLDLINRRYVADDTPLVPMPGAVETVAGLHALGYRQICVSNSNRVVVDANVASLGIAPFLDGSVSLDDVRAGKPDPEPYLRGCQVLGLPSEFVAAIEDSSTGALSARMAGLRVIGFNDELSGSQVDVGCANLLDIPGLLARL